ncbi:MAG: hypothetical protein WCV90_06360 [Candidatus Woesearchaeota archaeon]
MVTESLDFERNIGSLERALKLLTKAYLLSGAIVREEQDQSRIIAYTNAALYSLGVEPRVDFSECPDRYTPKNIAELRKKTREAYPHFC